MSVIVYREVEEPIVPAPEDLPMLALFARGEQGAWYDPSDIERYMGAKGPELVYNGDQAEGLAGYSLSNNDNDPTLTIDSYGVRITKVDSPAHIRANAAIQAGKTYELTFEWERYSGNMFAGFRVGTIYVGNLSPGRNTITFTAAANASSFLLGSSTNIVSLDASFRNISIRELTSIPTATMFQDAQGTVPVTAVEQPVGLILDKRFGGARGPELWNDSVVSFGGGSSRVSTGVYRIYSADGAYSTVSFAGVEAGKVYEISWIVDSIAVVGGGITIDNTTPVTPSVVTTGRSKFIVRANSTAVVIKRAGGACDFRISNVSVREVPGNHASQSTTTARPVLSARVNQFPRSTVIAWNNIANMTREPQAVFLPEYGSWLAEHRETAVNGQHSTNHFGEGKVHFVAGSYITVHIIARGIKGRNLRISGPSAAIIDLGVTFDLSAGAVITKSAGVTATITPLGDGLFRCTATALCLTTAASYVSFNSVAGTAISFMGDPDAGIQIGAPDFRHEVSASSVRPYQRVESATDYDTVGFPHYLRFDGVDDFLVTKNIDLTGTDKVAVVAGMTKLNDTASVLVEASAAFASNQGTFLLGPRNWNGDSGSSYMFASRGTMASGVGQSGNIAAAGTRTDVVSGLASIQDDFATLRVNNSAATGTGDQGGGSYGNYPLYVGSRAGNTLRFTGYLYQLGIRGAATTADQLRAWEKAVAKKTGVNL